jgi:hypothetical protein
MRLPQESRTEPLATARPTIPSVRRTFASEPVEQEEAEPVAEEEVEEEVAALGFAVYQAGNKPTAPNHLSRTTSILSS